jgi:hypothetical protein
MKGIKGINKSVIPEVMPWACLSGIHFKTYLTPARFTRSSTPRTQRKAKHEFTADWLKNTKAASRRGAEKVKPPSSHSPDLSLSREGFLRNHNVEDLLAGIKARFYHGQEFLNCSGEGEVA